MTLVPEAITSIELLNIDKANETPNNPAIESERISETRCLSLLNDCSEIATLVSW
jgi:hypothetical protein